MSEFEVGSPPEDPVEQLASIGQRVGGALIDGLLTSMVVVVPLLLGLVDLDSLDRGLPAPTLLGLFLFGAIYTIVPTAVWGQTLGKIAMGIRVVVEEDGSLPGWRRSALRWALPGVAGRLPYVGLGVGLAVMASLVWDPRRRGLHDRLAGTVVVRVPR
ncbi:MAG: RDD family protein [Acidimicrobiales bacterium]